MLLHIKRTLPFIGPALLVSMGYIDPGNWATNIQSGATFNYALLWVILASNIMAIILQSSAAKLGIATEKSLAENCRLHFPRPVTIFLWVTAEIAVLATDLAEFLGAALGISIIFHLPLIHSALIAGVVTFFVLTLRRFGFRILEIIILGLLLIVAGSYCLELFLSKPEIGQIVYHATVPEISSESIFLAIGILGATVMPHNIYLHSSLVKDRLGKKPTVDFKKKLYRYAKIDTLISLNIAWFINSAMLIMAAAVFFSEGIKVNSISQAHETLKPLLGESAALIFAIALLASGISSSITGTLAGQYVIEGFLNIKVPLYVRRLITMVPALVVISLGVNTLTALVVSQVLLCLQLPFTVIPLVLLLRNKKIMGPFVNSKLATTVVSFILFVIILMNALLLYSTFTP